MLTRQAHSAADRTLAPCTAPDPARGPRRTAPGLWPRGVDVELFHPSRIDHDLRAQSRPTAGRSSGTSAGSPRRRSCTCWPRSATTGYKVVLVGGGPRRRGCGAAPERDLPGRAAGGGAGACTPPSTCSRTPAPTRRSARRSRRRSPPGSGRRPALGRAAGPGRRRRHRFLLRARQPRRPRRTSRCSTTTRKLRRGWGARPAGVAHKSWGA